MTDSRFQEPMQNHEGRQSSNGSDPLITVVLPIYNVAKWLDTCIQSIVKQTYRNLQIILVDDGSTDESPTICERWAAKDNRINVVIAQPQLRNDRPAWQYLRSLSAQSRTLCCACLAQPMSTAKRMKILFAALFSPLTFAKIRNHLRH